MLSTNIKLHLTLGLVVRLILLLYGEYMDKISLVKYTDIDYEVFTDAARFIVQNQSPYLRSTYRYTPLLAMLLTPNVLWFKAFGKCLFVLGDLGSAWLMYKILKLRIIEENQIVKIINLFWIYNPIVANISTRGNAESLLIFIILASLYAFLKNKIKLGSMLFGLAVHFKIYPIIYSVPLLFFINDHYPAQRNWLKKKGKRVIINPSNNNNNRFNSILNSLISWIKSTAPNLFNFITLTKLQLIFYSLLSFVILNLIFYLIYSDEFLQHTFLYHITRKDHRHNFSFWFLSIYLNIQNNASLSLACFFPQFIISFYLGFIYAKDVIFACFMQTIAFVVFNKVCTSQYFMWYLGLLPLVLVNVKIKFFNKGLILLMLWTLSQALWLLPAYYLEFEAKNTFIYLFSASLFMLFSNVYIMTQFIIYYNYRPIFINGQIAELDFKMKYTKSP